MGKSLKTKKFEDLRAINVQVQEENQYLKDKVQMFDWKIENLEKDLETSVKLLPLLKDALLNAKTPSVVMEDCDKSEFSSCNWERL